MKMNQVSIAQTGGARLISVLVILCIGGCQITVRYLNPQGVGTSRTVGNPCPYTYRTMEIRSTRDPDIRVSVSAFRKGEYRLKSTTLFVVISDRELLGPTVAQFGSRSLRKSHRIAFPSGADVTIQDPKFGTLIERLSEAADIVQIQDSLILTVPVPDDFPDEFSVIFPVIEIDGENLQLGTVTFTRVSETLYFSAC